MRFSASIKVVLKDGVLDPQGETIGRALKDLGFESIVSASSGRIFRLDIDAETEAQARKIAGEAASKLLANPVIERYEVEMAK
ncbi:MAG: phosphoribosylformylglycinamidine synthase, purS protein [candidate division Zixibacteria bacterium RBG_16_53_22]|nr:MAG: phosphoribosylformylglycinamidine synthase, purS protein [candidate division Zixibacteria bacterium RBG_16_53_22]